MEKARCFVALDLPREVMNYIKDIQNLVSKQNLFTGKFVEVENLHLTLKFLGEISEEEIEKVKEKLNQVKFNEFEVGLGEVGLFSSKYTSYIRVIWVELKNTWKLQKLVDEVLKEMFQKEARFMSHITIARVKKVGNRQGLIDYLKNIKVKKFKFKVNKFFLKKSELQSDGPVYEDLEVYELDKEK